MIFGAISVASLAVATYVALRRFPAPLTNEVEAAPRIEAVPQSTEPTHEGSPIVAQPVTADRQQSAGDAERSASSKGDVGIQHRSKEEMEAFENLERGGYIPEGTAHEYWSPEQFRRYVHSGNYQQLLRESNNEEVAKQVEAIIGLTLDLDTFFRCLNDSMVDAFVVPGASTTAANADGETEVLMNIGFDIHNERASWMIATAQLNDSQMVAVSARLQIPREWVAHNGLEIFSPKVRLTFCRLDSSSETYRGAITLELTAADMPSLERLVATGTFGRPVLMEVGRKSGVSTLGRAEGNGALRQSPSVAIEFERPVEPLRPIASGTCERVHLFLSTMTKLASSQRR